MKAISPLVALALLALSTAGCASGAAKAPAPLAVADPPLADGDGVEPSEPLAAEPAAPLPSEALPPATPSS